MGLTSIILSLLGAGIVGFLSGIIYCVRRLLPGIMARLDPERLHEIAQEAARIRNGE
jgi:hypothetical protein